MPSRYRVNRRSFVIHDARATEQCNLDDAKDANIEEVAAGAAGLTLLIRAGYELCEHCFKDESE